MPGVLRGCTLWGVATSGTSSCVQISTQERCVPVRLSLWLYEVQPAFREQNAQATPSPSTRRHCFVHEGTQCQWVNVRERCTGETVPLHSSPPDSEPHKNPMFVMVRESRNNRTETPPVSFPEDGSKTTQWALGIVSMFNSAGGQVPSSP